MRDVLFPPPGTEQQADTTEQGTAPQAEPETAPTTAGTLLADALPEGSEYWSMTVAVGDDGEQVSIEAMKDAYTQRKRTERTAADLDESKSQFQADQLRYRQELNQAVQALQQPGGLTQENFTRVQEFNAAWGRQQTDMVKAVAPEALSDQAQTELATHAKRYGVSREELALVEHAGFRLILDDWRRLRNRLDKAQAAPTPKAQKPQGGKPKPRSAEEQFKRGEITEERYVSLLLNGAT